MSRQEPFFCFKLLLGFVNRINQSFNKSSVQQTIGHVWDKPHCLSQRGVRLIEGPGNVTPVKTKAEPIRNKYMCAYHAKQLKLTVTMKPNLSGIIFSLCSTIKC